MVVIFSRTLIKITHIFLERDAAGRKIIVLSIWHHF